MTEHHCYETIARSLRTATATDFHKLIEVDGKKTMRLGLVDINAPANESGSRSLQVDAHSDGDIVVHAIADALLLAFGKPDLGSLTGIDKPEWKDASGEKLLDLVLRICDTTEKLSLFSGRMIPERVYNYVQSISVQIITARPKLIDALEPIKRALTKRFTEYNGKNCPTRLKVNVSAKTTDHMLSELGNGTGIACIATVLVLDNG